MDGARGRPLATFLSVCTNKDIDKVTDGQRNFINRFEPEYFSELMIGDGRFLSVKQCKRDRVSSRSERAFEVFCHFVGQKYMRSIQFVADTKCTGGCNFGGGIGVVVAQTPEDGAKDPVLRLEHIFEI